MVLIKRTFHPILSSPGPDGGMIAFAFATVEAELQLTRLHERDALPAHAGQRAVNHVLETHGIADVIRVDANLDDSALEHPFWSIALAVGALSALRDAITGLAERLYAEDILAALQAIGIASPLRDGHRVRAAMEPGVHVRIDHDGGAVAFELPDAAIVWIQPTLAEQPAAWTQAQASKIAVKRANARAERLAAAMLRAACNDGIAIFQAWEEVDVPETLTASYSGWLPAKTAAKNASAYAHVALVGPGPGMLIVADNEHSASAAAQAALMTFDAHAITYDVQAWSSLHDEEDLPS